MTEIVKTLLTDPTFYALLAGIGTFILESRRQNVTYTGAIIDQVKVLMEQGWAVYAQQLQYLQDENKMLRSKLVEVDKDADSAEEDNDMLRRKLNECIIYNQTLAKALEQNGIKLKQAGQ